MDSLYLLQFACFIFMLITMGIYNIEATHANRRKMNIVCTCIYVAIIAAFRIGYSNSGMSCFDLVSNYGTNLPSPRANLCSRQIKNFLGKEMKRHGNGDEIAR